ncbi:hypothetical protein [Paenibacillus methanolicus]|uniref:Uncharacterized protein n=1 Tax=Paenibacillus methanolicus TaxID=582686 RepID=A0A5S5CFZ5_9BACL|nr:hypothetical protein [Paenibacillus methanolicus]TYP77442.1 hypothetical protein BCM02_1022 [Paenibacillus methanolicus]
MAKKIDHETVIQLKSILGKLNLSNQKILLDLQNETLEVQEDDAGIEDLLEAAGTLSPERANELMLDVRNAREEWNR